MNEQIKQNFWNKLRKNIMWRDSESGIVERHIDELLDEVIKEIVDGFQK